MKPLKPKKRNILTVAWQERANLLTATGILVNVATMAIAVGAALITYKEWKRHELTDQATLLLHNLRFEEAFVTSKEFVLDLKFDAENKGKSAARDVLVSTQLYGTGGEGFNPQEELAETCGQLRRHPVGLGEIISAGETTTLEREYRYDSSSLKKAWVHVKDGQQMASNRLAICLTYRDEMSKATHHYGLLFDTDIPLDANIKEALLSGGARPLLVYKVNVGHVGIKPFFFSNAFSD